MIVFTSVSKTFTPDESGINDITFSIADGELVMLTGHSGSGKTTLMRLLTKEYTPSSGTILFEGTDLATIKSRTLHHHRRKIGVVFQDYRLIPELNVWENIALPLAVSGKSQSEIEERVTDLLTLVQLPQKAHLFPSQLSGGEAQRISIARALANAPSVIFADEPTGNLDQDTSQSIAHLLQQINELGTTLIFATHDPKILSIFADKRHIQLSAGSIAFDSKAKQEKQKPSKAAPKAPVKESPEKPITSSSKDENSKEEEKEETKQTTTTATQSTEPSAKKLSFWQRLFGSTPKKETSSPVEKEEDTSEKSSDDQEEEHEEPKKSPKKESSTKSEPEKNKDTVATKSKKHS